MPQKHILFLASWYPSKVLPYSGDFIQRHARAAALNNKVTVLHAIKDEDLVEKFKISFTEGSPTEVIVYFRSCRIKLFNFFRRLIAYNKGYQLIRDIDLVHLNTCFPAGIYALFLHYFKKKDYILSEHWTSLHPLKFRQLSLFSRLLIPLILTKSKLWLPVSQNLGNSMAKISNPKPIEVIPNVVDTNLFSPKSLIKNNSKVKFLHLSMLHEKHKNISGMLHVVKRLAKEGYSFEFHIGGNGSLLPINQFISENHLNNFIIPFGELSHEQVPQKMNECDCFIMFSNYENQPCVQGEAFATGLPLISTNVGGIAEFLPTDFGILIDKGDENALYNAMVEVINGKHFASKEEMYLYSKKHFSTEHIAYQLDNIYNSIVYEN
ncbi:MAG: glycosyltransferase [Saprospiraceae bacterium]|nr:glycosyltransferase [Saprospiraceae bacterium]